MIFISGISTFTILIFTLIMENLIYKNKDQIIKICKNLNVKRMYVFGSAISTASNEESDIDFLISFADDITPKEYTDNYFLLHYQLRDLFNREIDIVTERTLSNPYFIKSVNNSKQLIYEA